MASFFVKPLGIIASCCIHGRGTRPQSWLLFVICLLFVRLRMEQRLKLSVRQYTTNEPTVEIFSSGCS